MHDKILKFLPEKEKKNHTAERVNSLRLKDDLVHVSIKILSPSSLEMS